LVAPLAAVLAANNIIVITSRASADALRLQGNITMLNFVSTSVPIVVFHYIFYVFRMENTVNLYDYTIAAIISFVIVGSIRAISTKLKK
jgi:hypothetical protein